ncbi:MAG TPA: ribosomal protein L7/L12 [Candidatus Acidoferrales bacterium]|nr:ribosomal protein L7/L12 [Candidatus Acidoferrales bacterium]
MPSGVLQLWDLLWIFVVVSAAAAVASLIATALERARWSRLEGKIDRLLDGASTAREKAEAAPADVPAGVLEALERGNKIEAIKRYRAVTGVDLAEAKAFVERLETGKAT